MVRQVHNQETGLETSDFEMDIKLNSVELPFCRQCQGTNQNYLLIAKIFLGVLYVYN